VLDRVGFDDAIGGAALVISGEGCLYGQIFAGKAVGDVARRAEHAGVRCAAVVGRSRLSDEQAMSLGIQRDLEASSLADLEQAGCSARPRAARTQRGTASARR
jgi:glycerate kinase